jgi:TolB protein
MRYDDLASMLRLIGDYEQAIKFYQWAIDILPKAVSYTGLGLCQIQLGEIEGAAGSLENAVQLDSQYAPAHGNLALAYARLDRCPEALPAADQALALDPNSEPAREAQRLCAGAAAPAVSSAPGVIVVTATPVVIGQPGPEAPVVVAPPAPVRRLPSAPRISGQIAYPVYDVGRQTYDIYLANADGSNRRKLLADASSPDLSPDGSQIAYRSWDDRSRGLYAQELSGAGRRVLTENTFLEDTLPRWAPDGNLLTFASRRESDRRVRVYLASPAGKNDRVLRIGAEAAYGDTPTFTPDGRIVYSGCIGNNCGLLVVNNDGANPTLLTGDPGDIHPAVSPDGTHIAFMSHRDGNWEIYLVSLQGTALQRLTSNGANDGLPAWSPDGRSIAFGSDRNGHWAIWIMNADGSNQRELFALEGPLDGHVRQEQDFASRGWVDEHISWIP